MCLRTRTRTRTRTRSVLVLGFHTVLEKTVLSRTVSEPGVRTGPEPATLTPPNICRNRHSNKSKCHPMSTLLTASLESGTLR